MLKKLLRLYFSLSFSNKRIFWGICSSFLLYFLWNFFHPNPNKWTKINEFGIKIPLKYQIHGIDVSHHNGKIDWDKVSSIDEDNVKINFAFIKATEGTSIRDKDFEKNWKETKRVNIKRGAYHYYIPWRDPESQIAIFTKMVHLQEGDFPPVLDIEENSLRNDKLIIRDIGVWLKKIENYYGVKPIVYTNQSYFNKFIKGNFENYPLWIADYSKENLTLYNKEKLHFWQYSKKGNLPGIKGLVDFNSYLKSEETYEKLGK